MSVSFKCLIGTLLIASRNIATSAFGVTNRAVTAGRTKLHVSSTPTGTPLLAPDDSDDSTCDAPSEASKLVMLVSDSTGETAKSALEKTLTQFDSCDERFYNIGTAFDRHGLDDEEGDGECEMLTRMFTFVRSEEAVASIIRKAHERDALVIFTMADPDLRAKTARMCELSDVPCIDLLGPMLNGMSDFLQQTPLGVPMFRLPRRVALGDSYFRRIEAVEFTLKADDGAAPWLLKEADVVIVGVSRTGKTPLSVVLSQTTGLRVANVPLVLEVPPPRELLVASVDPRRVFCLTINPSVLRRIRTTRLERRRVKQIEGRRDFEDEGIHKSNYADRNYLLKDLKQARDLAVANDWTEIDVSGRAVEETASLISETLKERFEGSTPDC